MISIFIMTSVIILAGLSVIRIKDSKQVYCVHTFIAIVIACIMGMNYKNADYNSYGQMYSAVENFSINNFDHVGVVWYGYSADVGYNILTKLFLDYAIDYTWFRFIIFIAGFLTINIIAHRISSYSSVILLGYVIYPCVMDVIAFRNYFLEIFTYIAFYYYCFSKKNNSRNYIFWLFLGVTFHSSGLLLVPFALIVWLKKISNKYIDILLNVFIIIGLLMPAYAPFLLDVRSIAADSITLDVARRYAGYAEKEVNYGYLVMYIFTIFPLLILHHVRNKIKKCKLLKCERIYINNTYNLFWYFCMLMPLAPFVTAISRMPRNAFIIFMSAISIYLYRKRMSLINNAICICLLVIMFIGFNWIEMGRSDVVINYHYIMYDNYLNDFISGFFSGV